MLKLIQPNGSTIIVAPENCQSSNGFVDCTIQTLIHMAHIYITVKQVGHEFWFFAIGHAASMFNQVTGCLGHKLTSPFELVYNMKPNSTTWFKLFSLGYFPMLTQKVKGHATSNTKQQTLYGIAVRCND